jgi:hypothetical protein
MSLLQQWRAVPPQPDPIEPAWEPEVAPARGYAAWTAALAHVVRQATDAAFNRASASGAASVNNTIRSNTMQTNLGDAVDRTTARRRDATGARRWKGGEDRGPTGAGELSQRVIAGSTLD